MCVFPGCLSRCMTPAIRGKTDIPAAINLYRTSVCHLTRKHTTQRATVNGEQGRNVSGSKVINYMHSSCFGLSDDDNSSVQMDEHEDAEPIAPSKVQPRTSNDTRLLRMLEVASIPESLHVENRYVICTDNGEQSSKIYKGTSIDRSSSIFGHNKARKAFDGK